MIDPSQKVSKNKTFIRIDENDVIVQQSLTDIDLEPPWIDITDIPKLEGHENFKKRYDREKHEIRLKEIIELRVGTTAMTLGTDEKCCICVRGADLDPDEEVIIKINEQPHTITPSEDINLVVDEPGRYHVYVDDPKYYANPNSYMIVVEPASSETQQEEESNGA